MNIKKYHGLNLKDQSFLFDTGHKILEQVNIIRETLLEKEGRSSKRYRQVLSIIDKVKDLKSQWARVPES